MDFNSATLPPKINLGDFGYRHPELPGCIFGAPRNVAAHGKDPAKAAFFDSRPTVQTVVDQIRQRENELRGLQSRDWWNCEWLTVDVADNVLWPTDHDVLVYTGMGSSEGRLIHAAARKEARFFSLFTAKTFAGADDVWATVRRIAHYLDVA